MNSQLLAKRMAINISASRPFSILKKIPTVERWVIKHTSPFEKCTQSEDQKAKILSKTRKFILKAQKYADELHREDHVVERVVNNILTIGKKLGADLFYAEIIALGHDCGCPITNTRKSFLKIHKGRKKEIAKNDVIKYLNKVYWKGCGDDKEILKVAMEIARNGAKKDDHAKVSALVFRKYLELNFQKLTNEDITLIVDAIEEHSIPHAKNPYGKLIQDADKMDAWGYIGLYKALVDAELRNLEMLEEPWRNIFMNHEEYVEYAQFLFHVCQQLINIVYWYNKLHFETSKKPVKIKWKLFCMGVYGYFLEYRVKKLNIYIMNKEKEIVGYANARKSLVRSILFGKTPKFKLLEKPIPYENLKDL